MRPRKSHFRDDALPTFLRLSRSLSMAFKYPIEGPVILGAAKCQHLIAVALVPPCPRALEPHMTNDFVRRLNPPTANGIAPRRNFP